MEINGWRLFQHPLFRHQYNRLLDEVEKIQARQGNDAKHHIKVKLLTRITALISEEIPADPSHERFNQGNTLGTDYRQWKRAKFGRYRLFFRYDARTKFGGDGKAIVYAWINDEKTLRQEGAKNDPYAIFARGLDRGEPPDTFDDLLREAQESEETEDI